MRILLTSSTSCDPPRGGSTRANLAWLRHLAARGDACRAVASTPAGDEQAREREVDGIAVRGVPQLQRHPDVLAEEIRAFAPDWVLVSSEDVAQVLVRAAAQAAPGRMVYLAHTPQFLPFGPESWNADERAAAAIRRAAGVIVIGQHMAGYVRAHLGVEPAVIHPPIYGRPPYRKFGRYGAGVALMVNPCAVKGIGIFLALADRFPALEFAALEGWGTTAQDRAALARRPNVRLMGAVADIESVLAEARFLLMPSLWYEGFGLIVMEAMLRGVPVIASDSGGLEEAKRGTGYVVPVRPITRYERVFDDTGMPRAAVPEQEIAPWAAAMELLLNDEAEYWAEAGRSRAAAEAFVSALDAAALGKFLEQLRPAPPEARDLSARLKKLDPRQRARLLEQVRARKGVR